jgi:hypothetical protein
MKKFLMVLVLSALTFVNVPSASARMALAPVKPKEALTTLKVVPSDIVQTTGGSM